MTLLENLGWILADKGSRGIGGCRLNWLAKVLGFEPWQTFHFPISLMGDFLDGSG